MKKIGLILAGLLVVPVVAMATSGMTVTAQVDAGVRGGIDVANPGNVPEELDGQEGLITKIVNILLYAIGIVSVIMIIVGGIMYATSSGASEKVKNAKNTIMYSVIGLVVAIFAWAIVNWVIGSVTQV